MIVEYLSELLMKLFLITHFFILSRFGTRNSCIKKNN